jgi:hypothetical protein
MIQFDAAPAIAADYPRLCALTEDEIELARAAGYITDSVNLTEPVRRAGIDNCSEGSQG